jgi:hypothetical protein
MHCGAEVTESSTNKQHHLSSLPQYEVYKKLVWERGWGGGGKSDKDVYEVIIMDDSLRKLIPDLVILIEIEGI